MVGAVGDDAEGSMLRAALAAEGVDDRHVATVDVPTGLAVVLVHGGESTIVVAAGANGTVDADRVRAAREALAGAAAVVTQCEVPDAAIAAAAELASGLFVVNPAPAPPAAAGRARPRRPAGPQPGRAGDAGRRREPRDTRRRGRPGPRAAPVRDDGRHLRRRGGGRRRTGPGGGRAGRARRAGRRHRGRGQLRRGPGDAVVGGADVVEAARWAARAAALTVGRAGAIAALPRRAEL
jgi:ribokinase